MSTSDTTSFYDELAPFYHLLYGDWEQSIVRRAERLCVASKSRGRFRRPVHDAASGVGTQTLGLFATRLPRDRIGFVVGSDQNDCGPNSRAEVSLPTHGPTISGPSITSRRLRWRPSSPATTRFRTCCPTPKSCAHSSPVTVACGRAASRCFPFAITRPSSAGARMSGPTACNATACPAVPRGAVWEWDGDQYDSACT